MEWSHLDAHMETNHGKNKKLAKSTEVENEESIIELTCRACNYEGISDEDIKKHKDQHRQLKCEKCDFVAGRSDELKQHNQSNHKIVKVDLENYSFAYCTQCDYRCKYRIQLRNHTKNKHGPSEHTEEQKFKCNVCPFKTNFLLKIYEHKLEAHPEIAMEFNPKLTTGKDMAINLIAEQNLELMEEILEMKKNFKAEFEKLSQMIQNKCQVIEQDNKKQDEKITAAIEEVSKKLESYPTAILQPIPPPVKSSLPAPPQPSSQAPSQPKPAPSKKTAYLQKDRLLFVGDSVAHSVNFGLLEYNTNTRIKTMKAYSAVEDLKARWPHKNVTDVTATALLNVPDDDKFTKLVLAAPTVDISNLDTEHVTKKDNIEIYKQKVMTSCLNMFSVATNAVISHPEIKKVLIMEHAPRHDKPEVDPTGLKSTLAKFANSTLDQLWHSSDFKNKIVIGKHSLDVASKKTAAVYRDDWSGRFDGVHMYGRYGKKVYTSSVSKILKSSNNSPSSPSHSSCPQTVYQNKQRFSVPVSNRFSVLGN